MALNVSVTQNPAQQVSVVTTSPIQINLIPATKQNGVLANYLPTKQLFIGPNQPVAKEYIWIQTGMGPSGTDFSFWFEDGS